MSNRHIGLPRRIALMVAPLPGESLYSWLDTVAADYGITRSRAALITALADERPGAELSPARRSSPVFGASEERLARFTAATGLGSERFLDMTWQRFVGTTVPDPAQVLPDQPPPRLFLREFLHQHFIDPAQVRICPSCLAEDDGRWPLLWSVPWLFVCPRHRCYLVDRCPECGKILGSAGVRRLCGRRRRANDSPCRVELAAIAAPDAADEQLIGIQQHVLDLLDTPTSDQQARDELGDLWAMTTMALFLATPEHLSEADPAVRDGYDRYGRVFLARRSDAELHHPGGQRFQDPFAFAAAIRLAAQIVGADHPFETADALFGLTRQPAGRDVLTLGRSWRSLPLSVATHRLTRTRDIVDAVNAHQPHPQRWISRGRGRRFAIPLGDEAAQGPAEAPVSGGGER